MPSPIQRAFEDLEAVQIMKDNLERIDRLRDEFMKESEKCKQEENFLSEVSVEKDQLYREKILLIEEMKQVNNDINALETSCKQSENEKRRSYENAKRLLLELQKVKRETDSICNELQHEPLPDNLVDPEDQIKFQSAVAAPFVAMHHWPFVTGPNFAPALAAMAVGAEVAPSVGDSPLVGVGDAASVSNAAAAPLLAVAPTSSIDEDTAATSSSSRRLGGVVPTAAAGETMTSTTPPSLLFGKQQQPPPMKICNSCQQQIHRNAPICPLCKSKSRSRNPKKPKRKLEKDGV